MKQNLLIAGIIVFIVVAIAFGAFFSVAGDTAKQCTIPYGGGSCEVTFTLPAGREASVYALNFLGEGVSSDSLVGRTRLSHVFRVDGVDEDREDDEEEKNHLHLYKLPVSWSTNKIYVEASTQGTATANDGGERTDVEVRVKYLTEPVSNSLNVCTSRDKDNCASPVHIHKYRDRDGDDRFNPRFDSYGEIVDRFDLNPRNEDGTESGLVFMNAYLPVDRAVAEYGFLVNTVAEGDHGGRASVVETPVVYVSYFPAELSDSLSLSIGGRNAGDVNLDGFSKSLDIASVVNRACRDVVGDCDFTVTVSSDEGVDLMVDIDDVTLLKIVDDDVPFQDSSGDDNVDEVVASPNEVTVEDGDEVVSPRDGFTSDPSLVDSNNDFSSGSSVGVSSIDSVGGSSVDDSVSSDNSSGLLAVVVVFVIAVAAVVLVFNKKGFFGGKK